MVYVPATELTKGILNFAVAPTAMELLSEVTEPKPAFLLTTLILLIVYKKLPLFLSVAVQVTATPSVVGGQVKLLNTKEGVAFETVTDTGEVYLPAEVSAVSVVVATAAETPLTGMVIVQDALAAKEAPQLEVATPNVLIASGTTEI